MAALAREDEPSPFAPIRDGRRRLGTVQWTALGSLVSVAVTDSEILATVRVECDRLLNTFAVAVGSHRDSDVSRANASAGSWVAVTPLMIRLMTAAARVATTTSGLIPESEGWQRAGIDTDGAIQVPPGHELDLEPLVKAFAADLLVSTVPQRTGASMIVSVSNHIAVGRPEAEPAHSWQVAVAERPLDEPEAQRARVTGDATTRTAAYRRLHRPWPASQQRQQSDPLADTDGLRDVVRPHTDIVGLESGGLATSSARTPQRRLRTTSDYQLLSPGKGSSLDPLWHTVSVRAPGCVDACAATLAAMNLGEQAPAWLWERDLPARLVAADGRILRLSGWPG